MDEWEIVPRVAVATAMQAQADGVARVSKTRQQLYDDATAITRQAQQATQLLMRAGLIAPMPAAAQR